MDINTRSIFFDHDLNCVKSVKIMFRIISFEFRIRFDDLKFKLYNVHQMVYAFCITWAFYDKWHFCKVFIDTWMHLESGYKFECCANCVLWFRVVRVSELCAWARFPCFRCFRYFRVKCDAMWMRVSVIKYLQTNLNNLLVYNGTFK